MKMGEQNFSKPNREPIAIIGSACRFPGGASSPSKLWELLEQPRDVLKEIPNDRFSVNGFYHPDNMHHGTSNVRHSYTLDEDIRVFDASFFGIKPVEANSIDPQQRLLMETVYEGLESAGQIVSRLNGSQTAVYVGLMSNDYADMLANDQESFPTYFATGTARSIVSNRVSYFFNWHGPSMTIDTACSSSLVAVHLAVQALRSGDGTNLAVAAGTNLLLNPDQYISESKLKMLSPEGRSRMWDEKANGYARGDGIAVVVLKTLSQAIRDGDHIECLVRETQINQDGKTKGITMPSATAQAALIKATYRQAGLDISQPSDRPQFFEAHGTGTPAGDPIEAEAIHTAFFGDDREVAHENPLYVGSIKTIIGHTEGTAGLAALLKASRALQAAVIPPNLLFDRVNPKVKPYYGNLQIVKEAVAWPALAPGAVRRVSVNSFGFGGANAHAILEAYEPDSDMLPIDDSENPVYTSMNFSAASESALRAMLRRYADYLDDHPAVSLRDLSMTLNTRRPTFAFRTSLFGCTMEQLSQRLRERSAANINALISVTSSRTVVDRPRVLGVFTGQGAQWKRMGAELLETSPRAASILDELEHSLSQLPDGPSWSIKDELTAGEEKSRVNEAAISQPLCTAVQIVLVDLLSSAGIKFHTVVGHSSGEIAAAYAAGYISASDAIRIAYYRGAHLYRAQGPGGEQGAMMAAGSSMEDAEELCNLKAFKGRITVAASNSPTSVTLSGDSDAILQAQEILDDEGKFARLLKVDKAYHSHHMQPCVESYRQCLVNCIITVNRRPKHRGSNSNTTTWISSVYGEDVVEYQDELNADYWIRNMALPVLFSQALEFAVAECGPFDLAVECGPHPALKGPALQVLKATGVDNIPYTGLLSRGQPDVESLASALSYLWQALGENVIDYRSFDSFIAGPQKPAASIVADLPTYAWDHERSFWHESRQYNANRTKTEPPHELLGTKCPDGTAKQHRWRNMLRPREIPWLSGHQVQGQMVFPATGYVSAAIEAVLVLAKSDARQVQSIAVHDFTIGQAITFNDEYASVETQVTLTDVHDEPSGWACTFAFYSASATATSNQGSSLEQNASGHISVTLGEPLHDLLPPSFGQDYGLIGVDQDRFYEALGRMGFEYKGPFRALSKLQRRMGLGTGVIQNPTTTDPAHNLLIHPATLDAAVQSIILAYCYPNDGRLRSVHLPTGIKRIQLNPVLLEKYAGQYALLPFRAAANTDPSSTTTGVDGDVDIFDEAGTDTLIQLEGLQTKPLASATPEDDVPLFLETKWGLETPSMQAALSQRPDMSHRSQLCFDIERVAFFYLRHLAIESSQTDRQAAATHHQRLFEYIDHTITEVQSGKAKFARTEWMQDTIEETRALIAKYPDSLSMRLMHVVGEHLVPVVRGETTMLEYMLEDNLLNDFYVQAAGFDEYTESLTQQVNQLSHRYPHMNILEIGAGTGGATKRILSRLGNKFASYTYTDISSGFFEKAQEVFRDSASRMIFKALNVETDPVEQGFTEHSYDVVIASLVLHATHSMEITMKNVRRLLKPGGYLVMLELGDYIEMRTGLIFGSLPGWWMGYDDGRKLSPTLPSSGWATCLAKTGFTGVDALVPQQDDLPISFAVITAQAADNKVNFLRDPWAHVETLASNLTIIGGQTSQVSKLVDEARALLSPFYEHVTVVKSIAESSKIQVPFMGSVLCLSDLDEPLFRGITQYALAGAQQLFTQSRSCLWVTQGAQDDNPYHNMSIGLSRVVNLEMSHLRFQSLDLHSKAVITSQTIPHRLLQLEALNRWEELAEPQSLLWSIEPEIALDVSGQAVIPRLVPSAIRNSRYNSSRRRITFEQDATQTNLKMCPSGTSYVIQGEAPGESSLLVVDGRVPVEVSHSTLHAIAITQTDYAFLVLGRNKRTQEQVIALSSSSNSCALIHESWMVPYAMPVDDALCVMFSLRIHLIALAALSRVHSADTIVLVEPSDEWAAIVSRLATEKGICVISLVTTSEKDAPSTEKETGSNRILIHPNAPHRVIREVLPKNTAWVFASRGAKNGLSARVVECQPAGCQILWTESLTSQESQLETFSSMAFLPSMLRLAFMRVSNLNSNTTPAVVAAAEVSPDRPVAPDVLFFSWTSPSSIIPVQYRPIDSQVLFSDEKTYWLVGLSGGLGLSLCEWMIRHGAKYIVITSRNPQIDSNWKRHVQALGGVVKIYANDITNRESVRAVYQRIQEDLPPVGGVAQGAMVLADAMFVDLDLARVQQVIAPKVQGAIYLEELFAHDDLEFFVFFSSMASVTGNQGQAIYSAANAYMTSLAAQRRKRGRAGSAINIGTIIGTGYVTRQLTVAQQEHLAHMGNIFMSEQDFHQIFAEAVVAGRPSATDVPELMTGVRPAKPDESETVTWFHNPKFSHCILWSDQDQGSAGSTASRQNISVKAQLLMATTAEEVRQVIEDGLVAKLRTSLQIDSDVSIVDQHADQLGLDSLVAVDIRSWFIKEIAVEIPVLKILGGFTVAEMVASAQDKLSSSLIPNLGKEIDPALKAGPRPSQAPSAAKSVQEKAQYSQTDVDLGYGEVEDDEDEENEGDNELMDLHGRSNPETIQSVHSPSSNLVPSFDDEVAFQSKSSSNSESQFDSESDEPSRMYSMKSSATSIDYLPKPKVLERERIVPMSFGQTRFWFLKAYLQDQTTFNITTSIRLTGKVNIPRFAQAVQQLGKRHEAIRTAFFMNGDKGPMQAVLKEPTLKLEHTTQNTIDEDRNYARIKNHQYDLAQGETMRIAIFSSPTQKQHQLIIGYHHINMDGISLEVIIRELQQLYDGTELPPVSLQYPDFALQQQQEHSSKQWEKELSFWRYEFESIPETLPILPPSPKTVRSPLAKYDNYTVRFELDAELASQIDVVCKRTKTTPFNFYLATFKTLLYRLAGGNVDDICIGMADGGRSDQHAEDSVGFFLNLLPLRFQQLSKTQVFSDALKETRRKVVAALANSKVPFDVLLNEVNAPRSSTANPLFQAFINYRQGVEEKRHFVGCDSEATQFDGSRTPYDLSLDILGNHPRSAVVYLAGQTSLYTKTDVESISQSYVALLKAFARNPALRISRPSLYDHQRVQSALALGKGPSQTTQWPPTLVHRIDEIVEAHGANVSLRGPQSRLNYEQMATRINAIAATLISNGLERGSRIGVLQDPSPDFICTFLATLRIGAIFVPLEHRLGNARQVAIAEDSRLSAIVYDKFNQQSSSAIKLDMKRINVSLVPAKISTRIANDARPNETAVILYTSGSTGKPKGIQLSHSNWCNQIQSSSEAWNVSLENPRNHLQQSSWSFDISLSQTLVALCNGASLFMVPKDLRGDSRALSRLIVTENISHVQATPSELVSWLRYGNHDSLRQSQWCFAMTGGEAISLALIEEIRRLGKPDLQLVNAYGPAETTLAIGSVPVDYQTSESVDTPFCIFPNYSIYILDSQLQPVPQGVLGEIFVGGAGVAKGYLNENTLSAERFLPNDFAPSEYIRNGWTTMHRSGDQGYLSKDGRLVLKGRVDGDTQIKLRGMRIDVQDIESTLLQSASGQIQEAIVSLRSSGETEYLVAHVVLSRHFPGDTKSFLDNLRISLPLPQYMQPAAVIAVESLPTNLSGKIDRKRIKELPLTPASVNTTQSAGVISDSKSRAQGVTDKLKEIWSQVLGTGITSIHQIDARSDFFHVGGSSLTLVDIQAKIRDIFNVDLPLIHLFENSTLEGMARRIEDPVTKLGSDPTTQSLTEAPFLTPGAFDQGQPPLSPTDAPGIQWDQETALTADLYELAKGRIMRDTGVLFKTVAITGATGFLGKAIIRRMLTDPHIEKIHAIAVRRRRSDLPAIFSDPKVELHLGNLNAPRFGLSESAARDIFSETDAMIHNGADVSFLKTYQTLAKTNLESTREIVKMTLPYGIPIHFISSASVVHLTGQESFGEASVASFLPPADGSDGYTATKWASERFLEKVSEEFSLPVWIHRPSSIMGEDAPALDLMTNMLELSKKMRIAPTSPAWQGSLDFVDVDRAASDIVEEVKNDSADAGGLVKYLYESGDMEIAVNDMKAFLEEDTGDRYQEMSLESWVHAAAANGLDGLVASYLANVGKTPILFPRLVRTTPRPPKAPKPSSRPSLREVIRKCFFI